MDGYGWGKLRRDWSGGGAVLSGARNGTTESPLAWGISADERVILYTSILYENIVR